MPRTEEALDRAAARLVDDLVGELDSVLHNLKNASKNHDCVVLYDTITVERPDLWNIGDVKEIRSIPGWTGPRRGNPEYTLHLVVKRQA